MAHPRMALTSGMAGAAGAALLLTGRLDGSVVVVAVLLIAARAASCAAWEGPAAVRALARQAASVPVWIAVTIVGAVRAGSVQLPDVRGANAVAGIAVARGPALLVAACILAVAAGVLATLSPTRGDALLDGAVTRSSPFTRIEMLAAGLQILFLVTLFSGPQVREARDLVPWILAAAVATAAVWLARSIASWDWVPRVANALAIVGVVLAVIGEPL